MKQIKIMLKNSFKSKVLRLSGLEMGFESTSRLQQKEDYARAETLNSEAYLLSKKRMHEVEAEKAVMISVSRHPRWVAGGPH